MGLASDVHLHETDVPDVKTLHHTHRALTLTVLVLQSVPLPTDPRAISSPRTAVSTLTFRLRVGLSLGLLT